MIQIPRGEPHRTKMVERGILFPKHLAGTRNEDTGSKNVTRTREKGVFSKKLVSEIDKDR